MHIKKIVVIGPECTGKSTLSESLAKELHTVWVPEYAREYLEKINRDYTEDDLLEIANGQLNAEKIVSAKANNYLICDTDLYVIKVWSEHKYNRCNRKILEQIALQSCDLYLVTDIDLEWEFDPLREHPKTEMRSYFYNQYKDIVMNSNAPWMNISGNYEQRIHKALQAIQNM